MPSGFAFPYDANGVDRELLARLHAEEPWIDLFFDSGEMLPDRDFMVNRLIVDGATSLLLGGSSGAPQPNINVP